MLNALLELLIFLAGVLVVVLNDAIDLVVLLAQLFGVLNKCDLFLACLALLRLRLPQRLLKFQVSFFNPNQLGVVLFSHEQQLVNGRAFALHLRFQLASFLVELRGLALELFDALSQHGEVEHLG